MTEKTEKTLRIGRLKVSLFNEASGLLTKAAEWSDRKDTTWPIFYAEAALKLLVAANSL